MKQVKHAVGRGFAAAAFAAAFALAGCLFPSFDQFQPDDASRDAGRSTETTPTRSEAATTTPNAADGGDASVDPATGLTMQAAQTAPTAAVIKCGSASCKVGTEFCCEGITSSCTAESNRDSCIFAARLHCDGSEDCPSGESCCAALTDPDIVCRAGCTSPSIVVCTGAGLCPAGQHCTVPLDMVEKGCQ